MDKDAIVPNLKLIALLVLVVAALVVILQNTHTVVTRLIFVTIGMSLADLLAFTLLIGFAGGIFAALKVGQRR